MSTSSEESSDTDSDEGSGIVTVGGPQKPFIDKAAPTSSASDLQARLAALLPELAAANRQLEQGGKDYDMEDVQDGEQHIEMNLGLGVLEEKHGDETSAEEESSEDESEVDEDTAPTSLLHEYRPQDKDTRVMQKLTGQHKTMQRKVAIEELG
ncbi:hypothetical protein BAUCODRAFT_22819 [Baudoinia panamericana UAMH 10762]|uniref:Uncharacterized protein n=1 Tax=Baudoinia panamericana (strain UAMH 10762) TaxID=717646 RepID=M2NFD1_BAUPA|nr:uncharacterized protein BAUCODRAFT_22819 [Baudoinia panamericana UAMH 10762]EMC97954.1 hypothetical protein BAUCODRAFT_22819 [Baudoinia panamericana UAMH 10762]